MRLLFAILLLMTPLIVTAEDEELMAAARESVEAMLDGLAAVEEQEFEFDKLHGIRFVFLYDSEGSATDACDWLTEQDVLNETTQGEDGWRCSIVADGYMETERLAKVMVLGHKLYAAKGGKPLAWEFLNPELAELVAT